jgi:hypothetical protein
MKKALLSTIAVVGVLSCSAFGASAQMTKEQTGIARDPSIQYEEPIYSYPGYYYYYRRPNSVLPGTAQFGPCGFPDRGISTSDLNLNNRCDNEEFWRRNNENAPSRN